jgi:heme-degrading monooxygenase HmoA
VLGSIPGMDSTPEQDDPWQGPVAVAVCACGPAGAASWIEEMHIPAVAGLTRAPGFRRLLWREVIHGGPDRMYVSLTAWDTAGCFQAWQVSPGPVAARAAAADDLENSRRLRRGCRYELPLPGGRVLEDLDPVVLTRAAFDYPWVWDPAGFRDVLQTAAAR